MHSVSTGIFGVEKDTNYRIDLDASRRAHATTMMPVAGTCDESKCVSKGRSSLHNNSFTCYGDDGTNFPTMCADGYLPLTCDDQRGFMSNNTDSGDGSASLSYFTCCPPQHHYFTNAAAVGRQCSDPVTLSEAEWREDWIINAICKDDW